MGLIGAVLSGWLTNYIRSSNVDHARDTATYSMSLVIGTGHLDTGPKGKLTAAKYAVTTVFLQNMVATGKFVGATAWTSPDVIGYAVEPGRLGNHERPRPQLAEALRGKVVSTVVRVPSSVVPDVTERSMLSQYGPLLEVFSPVIVGGKVIAAVELYQRWTPVEQAINHEVNQMLLLVSGGLLVLWTGLISLVISASRQLRLQVSKNLFLASHDPLTGLPNRKLLEDRVEQALRSSKRTGRGIGLLLLDLDRFKAVNDTLGHHVGDLLLQQVGPRLAGIVRNSDTVARLGGDEFVVLMAEPVDPGETAAAARRIRAALSRPFLLDSVTVDVDVSVGIAFSPEHGTDFGTLLRHADKSMYAAKTSGSGPALQPRADPLTRLNAGAGPGR